MPAPGVELAITASGDAPSCALRTGAARVLVSPPGSSTSRGDLATAVDALFREAGVARASLSRVLLDVGPGSFTGLRVAVTFARFVSEFGSARLSIVTSLELLALAATSPGRDSGTKFVRPILDARRGRFHTLRVEVQSDVAPVGEPRALPLDALITECRDDELILADEGVTATVRTALEPRAGTFAPLPRFDAGALFDARLAPRDTTPEAVEPLYLMGTYAEPA